MRILLMILSSSHNLPAILLQEFPPTSDHLPLHVFFHLLSISNEYRASDVNYIDVVHSLPLLPFTEAPSLLSAVRIAVLQRLRLASSRPRLGYHLPRIFPESPGLHLGTILLGPQPLLVGGYVDTEIRFRVPGQKPTEQCSGGAFRSKHQQPSSPKFAQFVH